MATSHLMTSSYVPHFDVNSLILSFGENLFMEVTLPDILNWKRVKVVETVFSLYCISSRSLFY